MRNLWAWGENMSMKGRRILLGITAALIVILIGLIVIGACGGGNDYVPVRDRIIATETASTGNPLCDTPAALAYITGVNRRLGYISDASFDLSDLMIRAEELPHLLVSVNWRDDFDDQLHIYEKYSKEFLDMDPPPAFIGVSDKLDDMADDLLSAVEYYEIGVKDLDPTAFELGAIYVDSATSSLRATVNTFTNVCDG